MSNGQNNPNGGNKQGGREDQKRSDNQRVEPATDKKDPQQRRPDPAGQTPGNDSHSGKSTG